LEIGQQFSDWIKNRIEKYGFEEGRDYHKLDFIKLGNQKTHGGDRRSVDYLLIFSAAKKLRRRAV
jgi:anti-repressor protein